MLKTPQGTLFVILVIAFLAPLAAHWFRRLRVPGLVFEIGLGIVVGPAVLDLVRVSEPIDLFAQLGLATLIFLAGLEIDPSRVKGRPIQLAAIGWVVSIGLGLLCAFVLTSVGVIKTEMFVAFALATTALGTLLPIVRDSGLLPTKFGTHVLAIGAVGEFGPIVAVALVLSGASTSRAIASLTVFMVVAVAALFLTARVRTDRFHHVLSATLRSSGQLYVRLAILLVAALTLLANQLGLDFLLGAFTAGALFRLFLNVTCEERERDSVEAKVEAVSYGYLVPIFFVVTGIQFDLASLTSSPAALLKLPLFLVLFLVVRGIPILLYRKELPDRRERTALAFLSATALPLVVAITTIGVATGQMYRSTAAAMVGAAMCSVVLGPLLGLRAVGHLVTAPNERGAGSAPSTASSETANETP